MDYSGSQSYSRFVRTDAPRKHHWRTSEMAKKVYVQLVDDIDDKPIESGGEHIAFSVNGVDYEIDLSDKNAKEFHRKLNYYIDHSARVGGKRTKKSVGTATAGGKRDANQTKAIREW